MNITKGLALTLVCALCLPFLSAQRTETDPLNANDWLKTKINSLEGGWGRNGQYPRGTITVPDNTNLNVYSPLVIPTRVCLKREEMHISNFSHSVGFKAVEEFPENKFVLDVEVKQRNKNFNGNFGTHFHNLFVQGNRKSYGVRFGGAQCSTLKNFTSINCANYNLYLGKASRNLILQSINLSNYKYLGNNEHLRAGTGLYMRGVNNINITDLAGHSFETGVNIKSSQCVNLVGANFEKVHTPLKIEEGSVMIDVRGVVMEMASHIAIDLTKNRGGVLITGILKHSPYDTYLAMRAGNPLPVREGVDAEGKPLDPKGVYFKDYDGKLRLITTAAVKHNFRRGFAIRTSEEGRKCVVEYP